MKRTFNLSANIESGFAKGSHYIVTPNAKKAISHIVHGFNSGVHSYTIIGTYGTGKSSFLLAMEADLRYANKKPILFDPHTLSEADNYEILNIVGDYCELLTILQRKLNNIKSGESVIDALDRYYKERQKQGKFLVIVIDEFGKILEHAAKNNPEKELYFLQQFAEYVNDPSRHILLITTLHQNFGSYAKNLTEEQKNEWKKVKGRFMEVAFVEPIEQLLHLASVQLREEAKPVACTNAKNLHRLAVETGFVAKDFEESTAMQLYPLDIFSAYAITSAIQRYGQNERSLFSFLSTRGEDSVLDFCPEERLTYNLAKVFDYITYNFQSSLSDANADSMAWATMQHSIERVENEKWDSDEHAVVAIRLIKALGLMNTFGNAGFRLDIPQFSRYAKWAMNISKDVLDKVIQHLVEMKVVRFAAYKGRLVLFEGTDIDLEAEFHEAGLRVPRPIYFVDRLSHFFHQRIAPVKAHFYHKGTPRFFDYKILEAPERTTPDGDTDGYIELVFSTKKNALKDLKDYSASTDIAIVFAFFKETESLVNHLYNIDKYEFLLDKVVVETDHVARDEFKKLLEHEQDLLNKELCDSLFSYKDKVVWIYNGEEQNIHSHRDFNKLLSRVCDEVYCKTPEMNNELFNRHKLSGSISTARKNYLTALIEHNAEEDLGFPEDKFPPEKTIYYSLLKDTGLHHNGEFSDADIKEGFRPLWDASEEFLQSTVSKPRRISELIGILTDKPYKVKQRLLDFWIPTYLFIRRQDFALYDATRGSFIPNVNMEFFDLLQKHPRDYQVKKFAVDGVKLGFFNQYRRFVNLGEEFSISTQSFIETIKPFLSFYVRLNDYTKHTRKFNHLSTMRFRDVLAKAKDPEQAFFEDLPDALGFDRAKMIDEQTINEYGQVIERAIRELRTCYTNLIDRIEEHLVDEFELDSGDYSEYITEIRQRLANVKTHLLTGKQKEFYHHVMTEYDNRTQWYQSICYTILDQRLDTLRDEQEDKLVDDLVFMFRECEKYSDISRHLKDSDNGDAYSFDMVTNQGTNIRTQTYILPEKDKKKSSELEEKINRILWEQQCRCLHIALIIEQKDERKFKMTDKPTFVYRDGMTADGNYVQWLSDIKSRYRNSQIKAAVQVNKALLEFYWSIGRDLVAMKAESEWGSGFFNQLSLDLREAFPQAKGFSSRNLRYMREWYLFYYKHYTFLHQDGAEMEEANLHQDGAILGQRLVDQMEMPEIFGSIPWKHHVLIFTKSESLEEALFYINKVAAEGWSRAQLEHNVDSDLYVRQGSAVSNFESTLPVPQSKLAQEILKDPYGFSFLTMKAKYDEHDLEKALVSNVTQFLLELGKGFSYVGRQMELQMPGGQTFFPDLIFYHIPQHRYVVIELKAVKYIPEFAGKLNFYVTAADELLRGEGDNPSVGLLICKSTDKTVVEWSLKDINKPLGVASYQLEEVVARTIAEIEQRKENNRNYQQQEK